MFEAPVVFSSQTDTYNHPEQHNSMKWFHILYPYFFSAVMQLWPFLQMPYCTSLNTSKRENTYSDSPPSAAAKKQQINDGQWAEASSNKQLWILFQLGHTQGHSRTQLTLQTSSNLGPVIKKLLLLLVCFEYWKPKIRISIWAKEHSINKI